MKRFVRYSNSDLCNIEEVSLTRDILRLLLILTLQYSDLSVSNLVTYFILSRQFNSRTYLKTTISKTKKTFLYNSNFEQNLIDNYIYSSYYNFSGNRIAPKSDNWKNINKRLKKSRLSLSLFCFTDKKFNIFVQINSRILNKNAVIDNVFSVIQDTARILSAKNLIFKNLESLIRGNLIDAKSDFYNRVYSAQIDLRIREELELYIISTTQRYASALFNIFTKTKDSDRSATVAKRQACFDNILNTCNVYKL